nr:hypothetical protein [uncultured Campylobacter sp.]
MAYGTNSWSLTRFGKVVGISSGGLKKLLGAGDAEIRLSIR